MAKLVIEIDLDKLTHRPFSARTLEAAYILRKYVKLITTDGLTGAANLFSKKGDIVGIAKITKE